MVDSQDCSGVSRRHPTRFTHEDEGVSRIITNRERSSDPAAELGPLLAEVRAGLVDLVHAPAGETLTNFLNAKNLPACVQLADAWRRMRDTEVAEHFSSDDRNLLDLVGSVYGQSLASADTVHDLSLDDLTDHERG